MLRFGRLILAAAFRFIRNGGVSVFSGYFALLRGGTGLFVVLSGRYGNGRDLLDD